MLHPHWAPCVVRCMVTIAVNALEVIVQALVVFSAFLAFEFGVFC